MSDEPEAGEAVSNTLTIPVVKSKGTVQVDTGTIPVEYYKEALAQGLKVIVNGGASKINKETYTDPKELMAAAQALAEERVAQMMAGTLKLGRKAAASGKTPHVVMTEARRLARDLVKTAMKNAGLRLSHYKSSEITEAANAMIAQDASLIKMAEANIEARGKLHVPFDPSKIHADPGLVAKAEKEKAEKASRKVPLSALQAGKPAPRASHTTH